MTTLINNVSLTKYPSEDANFVSRYKDLFETQEQAFPALAEILLSKTIKPLMKHS